MLKKHWFKAIKRFAKDIHTKYIDPPHTTDFGIMFLPVEGLYVSSKTQFDSLLPRNIKLLLLVQLH